MARPDKKAFRYKYVGRSSKLTAEVVTKLEECAAVRATVAETIFYAGISKQTYHRWMKENPELSDRLDDLRQKPFLKARQTIISRLDDVNVAFRFMEKEKPEDYGDRLKIEHSGQIAQTSDFDPEVEALRVEYIAKMREKIRKHWEEKDQPKP